MMAIGLIVAWNAAVSADEILFMNGEKLVGKIESVIEGKLKVASETAGTVTVDFATVRTFSTDRPVVLHFRDGTVTRQKVNAADDGRIATEGTELVSAHTFAVADIIAVNPPLRVPPKWKGNATAGYTITRGNSETDTANVNVDVLRRGEKDRITLKGAYLYGRQEDPSTGDDKITQDKWFASTKYDYFFDGKTYVFGTGRLERNKTAHLDNRLSIGAGVGYQWVESDAMNLSTEAGLGWLYENYDDEDSSQSDVIAQFSYHIDRQLNEHVTALHDLSYYPALEDLSSYFLTTQVELRASITKTVFASFKIVLDYDSTPAREAEKTDLTYILGIGVRLF
jgi:putative salt-induced outer membrane protein YdiY